MAARVAQGIYARDMHTVRHILTFTQHNAKLHFDAKSSNEPRRITISVDVPTIDVVHTATLTFRNHQYATEATVGSPLMANVRISHTRRWNPSSASANKKIDFVYTLQDVSDVWLIGGQRRAHFSFASEEDEATFSVILIPLKPGTHLLPHVEINAVIGGSNDKRQSVQSNRQSVEVAGGEQKAGAAVSCETDYRNSGESVLVVRDTRTTTVTVRESVGAMSTGAGDVRVSEDSRMSKVIG